MTATARGRWRWIEVEVEIENEIEIDQLKIKLARDKVAGSGYTGRILLVDEFEIGPVNFLLNQR